LGLANKTGFILFIVFQVHHLIPVESLRFLLMQLCYLYKLKDNGSMIMKECITNVSLAIQRQASLSGVVIKECGLAFFFVAMVGNEYVILSDCYK